MRTEINTGNHRITEKWFYTNPCVLLENWNSDQNDQKFLNLKSFWNLKNFLLFLNSLLSFISDIQIEKLFYLLSWSFSLYTIALTSNFLIKIFKLSCVISSFWLKMHQHLLFQLLITMLVFICFFNRESIATMFLQFTITSYNLLQCWTSTSNQVLLIFYSSPKSRILSTYNVP